VRLLKREYYRLSAKDRAKQATRARRWFLANKEKAMANTLSWQKRNPDKHAALHAAHQQRRRAALLQRMPAWANLEEIKSFYHLAREMTAKTGIPHEVDHMVPLMGKLVSGLHVSNNLRVVPAKVNRTKGARFCWEDLQETA